MHYALFVFTDLEIWLFPTNVYQLYIPAKAGMSHFCIAHRKFKKGLNTHKICLLFRCSPRKGEDSFRRILVGNITDMSIGKLNSPKPVMGDVQKKMGKAMRSDPEDKFLKKAGLQKVCLVSVRPFQDTSPDDSAWCL